MRTEVSPFELYKFMKEGRTFKKWYLENEYRYKNKLELSQAQSKFAVKDKISPKCMGRGGKEWTKRGPEGDR